MQSHKQDEMTRHAAAAWGEIDGGRKKKKDRRLAVWGLWERGKQGSDQQLRPPLRANLSGLQGRISGQEFTRQGVN
jgi:hypothetical protein